MPVELDSLSQMRKKIFRVVAAGIKMELVRDFLSQQLFVHLLGGGRESIFIILSAINVDRVSSELCLVLARQKKWIVLVPMRDADGITENIAQQLG